jgi:hypothetical protein
MEIFYRKRDYLDTFLDTCFAQKVKNCKKLQLKNFRQVFQNKQGSSNLYKIKAKLL